MQQGISAINSNDLIEMLIKDTAYYTLLRRQHETAPKIKTVINHLNLIISELKKRGEYKDVFNQGAGSAE